MNTFDEAFSGLEAAIVMIAFVVIAVVFGYSLMSTGFFATEEAKETTVVGYKQASSSIYVEGAIYATLDSTSDALKKVWFTAGIPETGQPQDLTKLIIVYTHSKDPETFREYTYHDTTATSEFFGVSGGPVMQPGERRTFSLDYVDGPIPGGWFTIELKPQMGASTFVKYYLSDSFQGGSVLT